MSNKRTPGPAKMLTPKQMKFATLFVYGVEGNPVSKGEAAKLAGYADWHFESSRLLDPNKSPLVCAHISNLRDEVRHKYGISYEGHLEELGKIRDKAKKDNRNLAAAATTEIARGKVGGFYIDQKIIRHGSIEDMNLDQLYARMKTIKEKNEKVLEAKEILKASEESKPQSKDPKEEPQPSPSKIDDPD